MVHRLMSCPMVTTSGFSFLIFLWDACYAQWCTLSVALMRVQCGVHRRGQASCCAHICLKCFNRLSAVSAQLCVSPCHRHMCIACTLLIWLTSTLPSLTCLISQKFYFYILVWVFYRSLGGDCRCFTFLGKYFLSSTVYGSDVLSAIAVGCLR